MATAKLTKKQILLLKEHCYTKEDVLDASGMTAKEWKSKLQKLGKSIAIGVTPCLKFQHSIRNKSGNCIECNPVILKFMRQYKIDGDVYVAWSRKGRVAKIGRAIDANVRVDSLRETSYGGLRDWTLHLIYECTESGLVEKNTHKILRAFKVKGVTYYHNGRKQACSELFSCTLYQAKSALNVAVREYLTLD